MNVKENNMINFVFDGEDKKELTFGDVEYDQMFVDAVGQLCGKVDYKSKVILTDQHGIPCFSWAATDSGIPIQRILPPLKKIEF
jgi:hypothetical protein